jgi:hypothetical protein
LPFVLAAAWASVLAIVFWFPFDFRTDAAFIKSQLDFVQRVPFEVYYFGTEFRAITEVLRKPLFFAPLGCSHPWGDCRLCAIQGFQCPRGAPLRSRHSSVRHANGKS